MKNNKGFATSFMLFSILILFLLLLSILLFTMNSSTTIENNVKNKVINEMNKDINISALNIFYNNSTTGVPCETTQCVLDYISRIFSRSNSNAQGAKYLCKRATTEQLHKGSINNTEVTFGQVGTKGTLTSGDAFICDVNGDGMYDPEDEMFYYVSDYYDTTSLSFETAYATLIYYNNVSNGVSSNTDAYAYQSHSYNRFGPEFAITMLPTTKQWANISLYKNSRKIKSTQDLNEYGDSVSAGTLPSNFSYAGYSARLLTANELKTGCPNASTTTGSLDNCKYLLENTIYQSSQYRSGYWLETPYNEGQKQYAVWIVLGTNRNLFNNKDATHSAEYVNGIRPVIDVKKLDMAY